MSFSASPQPQPKPQHPIIKRIPKTIAVTSGKGGVGKTNVAVNTAIALARKGAKVCIFDADTSLANVNILLGLHPQFTLEHLYRGEKTIRDIILSGPHGVDVVPGAAGFTDCLTLDARQQRILVSGIGSLELDYDYLIIDTAAGISTNVLHFVASAQLATVVITPEPTSLTDAFSLLKVMHRKGYKRRIYVVVNMVSDAKRAKLIFGRFQAAVKKYLGMEISYLATIGLDESVRNAVTLQRPVALEPPSHKVCGHFFQLAEAYQHTFQVDRVPRVSFARYWEKLAERGAKKKSAPASPAVERKSESREERSSITSDNAARHNTSGHNTANPIIVSSNTQDWDAFRQNLNAFLASPNTSVEQVVSVMVACVGRFGDQLGASACDIMHLMMQSIHPRDFAPEHRDMIVQDLERLIGRFALRGIDRPAGRHAGAQSAEQSVTVPPALRQQTARQGEAQQLKPVPGEAGTVGSLLESIRYASLVRSERG